MIPHKIPNFKSSTKPTYLGGVTHLKFSPLIAQSEIGRLLGTSQAMVSKWVHGKLSMPPDKCRKLADIIEAKACDPIQLAKNLRAYADAREGEIRAKSTMLSGWLNPLNPAPHLKGDAGNKTPL